MRIPICALLTVVPLSWMLLLVMVASMEPLPPNPLASPVTDQIALRPLIWRMTLLVIFVLVVPGPWWLTKTPLPAAEPELATPEVPMKLPLIVPVITEPKATRSALIAVPFVKFTVLPEIRYVSWPPATPMPPAPAKAPLVWLATLFEMSAWPDAVPWTSTWMALPPQNLMLLFRTFAVTVPSIALTSTAVLRTS